MQESSVMLFTALGLFLCLLVTVEPYSLYNVTALRKHLFETNQYDKISRPMMDQSVPTRVSVKFNIYTVYDVEEVTQTLKISGSLHMEWLDEALVWDPADFGGINTGVYPQDHVWKPGVALKNSVEGFETVGDPTLHVVVDQNGTVEWDPFEIFTSRCVFDITYFPFDEQTCEMTFVTWGYRADDILLTVPPNGEAAKFDNFMPHPVWDLETVTYAIFNHPRPMITYYMRLQRKPRYIVSSIILPLIVLLILDVCVFILPGGSGEKASYAVTVFLSFVVFSTLVHDTLPVNSESVCFLSVYITAQVFQSAAITILAIVLIRLERRNDQVPKWLARLVLGCQARRDQKMNARNLDRAEINGNLVRDKKMARIGVQEVDDKIRAAKTYENIADELDWRQVVHILDWIIFVLIITTNTLLTCITFTTLLGQY